MNAPEGLENREHSCTAGGSANWYRYYGSPGVVHQTLEIDPLALSLLGICLFSSQL